MRSWAVGAIDVVRVDDPGHELDLPQDEATVAVLRQSPWLRPDFVTDDWSLRVGSSATVVRTGDKVVVVDPFLAFDDAGRVDARLAALGDAGVATAEVDLVVNTHVDGIGLNTFPDGSPVFPAARYLVPAPELEALRAGTHPDERGVPLLALWDAGTVEATRGDEVLPGGIRLEDAPGHNAGHHVVWLEDGGDAAVIAGHLFLHPAQIANPDSHVGDLDPEVLARTRRRLLATCAARGATLIGPLFADPGGGAIAGEDGAWRLAPA